MRLDTIMLMEFNMRKIIGLTIWWTEGTKSYRDKRWKNCWIYNVEVTNTNPQIIKRFVDFLRKDVGIDENRLKLQLQIHDGDDMEKLENYWSRISGIPCERFNKTFVRPKGNKVDKSMGTCKIRYSDKETYCKLSDQLDYLLKQKSI